MSTPDKSYGAIVGQRLRLVELNVWESPGQSADGGNKEGSKIVETIFEITVHKGAVSYLFSLSLPLNVR